MIVAGSKRVRANDYLDVGDNKRAALENEVGNPQPGVSVREEKAAPEWFNDCLLHIIDYSDVDTYRSLLSVSKRVHKLLDQQLLPAGFRERANMNRLRENALESYGYDSWKTRFGGEDLYQTSCTDFEEFTERFHGMLKNPQIKYLQVGLDDLEEMPIDQVLTGMVRSARERGEPIRIDLRIEDSNPDFDTKLATCGSLLKEAYEAGVIITAFSTDDIRWFQLLKFMPGLNQLGVDMNEIRFEAMNEALAVTPIGHPVSRLKCENWSVTGCEGEQCTSSLKRLGVQYLEIEKYMHRTLGVIRLCQLESLTLSDDFVGKKSLDVGWLLEGKTAFKSLILRQLNYSNVPSESKDSGADLGVVGCRLEEGGIGLERLEVNLHFTAEEGQGKLLLEVLKNSGIKVARLPYPLEYQKFVDRKMRAESDRNIVRTNVDKSWAKELEELCPAALDIGQ